MMDAENKWLILFKVEEETNGWIDAWTDRRRHIDWQADKQVDMGGVGIA